MPILLLKTGDLKDIHIFNDAELAAFQAEHSDTVVGINIRDCLSSDLADANIYAEGKRLDTSWPSNGNILSEELIQKIVPIVAEEQRDIICQGISVQDINNSEECQRTFIPICKDRELIAMFLKKGDRQDFLSCVHNPNEIHHWGIPSVPVCHVPMVGFDLAISECLHEHVRVIWQRTAENTCQRIMEVTDSKLTWLQTPDDLYSKLVIPFLNMLQTLHIQKCVNHGDITDDNVVLSEEMGQLFFIDFESLGSIPYVAEEDKVGDAGNYYLWHMERLHDLAYLAYSITNLADRYFPNIKNDDCIVQYFARLGSQLEEVCDMRDDYVRNDDDFEFDTDCLDLHIPLTITDVITKVRQLNESLTAITGSLNSGALACETNAHDCDPKKLVRKFSIYCEGHSSAEDEQVKTRPCL